MFASLLLLLAACSGPEHTPPAGTPPVGDSGTAPADGASPDGGATTATGDTGADSGSPPEAVVTVEVVGDQDDDLDSWIYSPTTVHQIAITLDEEAVASLYDSPYEYVLGQATVMGEEMPDVGVRLRGRIGSFRDLSGKPKLRIDFNQYIEDQRFHGTESFTLNNAVVDCSYMKEALGYRVFRGLGVPAPRTSYAWVTINGADYGLYVMIETVDDRFLARHYDDPSGNLYDGKYWWWPNGAYVLIDFVVGVERYFELQEGEGSDLEDVIAIIDAVTAAAGTDDFDETLEPLIDWDRTRRHMLGEQWIGQLDGYVLNTNNFWVYFDPGNEGRAELLPYDLDYAFFTASTWGMSWTNPRGVLAEGCLQDDECAAAWRDQAGDALAAIDAMDLPAFLADVGAATSDQAYSDPRRECGSSSVTSYRDWLDTWTGRRNGQLEIFWGLP